MILNLLNTVRRIYYWKKLLLLNHSAFTADNILELQKLWTEHQDAEGGKVPSSKATDVYWSAGFILGNEYSTKFEEELTNTYGRCYQGVVSNPSV